jgi:glycosyltransferase involved in cell wall biosynthesis
MEELISVIMPAFNAEKYILTALESVLKQTYKKLEIILVNDGSTDGTEGLVQKLQNTDSRIKLLTIKNRGRAGARNYGVAQSTGAWLAFLDADDFWYPNKLELQYEKFQADNAVGLIYSERTWVDEFGVPLVSQPEKYNLPEGKIFLNLVKGNYLCTSTVIIRKDIFTQAGTFDEGPGFKNCQDYDLWIRASVITTAAAIKEPLCCYRLHDENAHKNIKSRYLGMRSCMQRLREVATVYFPNGADLSKKIDLREMIICKQFGLEFFKAGNFDIAVEALSFANKIEHLPFKAHVVLLMAKAADFFKGNKK